MLEGFSNGFDEAATGWERDSTQRIERKHFGPRPNREHYRLEEGKDDVTTYLVFWSVAGRPRTLSTRVTD